MNIKPVVCIGRATIDLVSMVETFPPSDGKISALQSGVFSGGPALNAAITASVLSQSAVLLTSVGQHRLWSTFILDELARFEVSLVDIADAQSYVPPVSQIISTRSTGARSIINQPSTLLKKPADCDISILQRHVGNAATILLDQFESEFVSANFDTLSSASCTRVLDAGSFKPQTNMFLQLCDIPIVSERFCADIGLAPESMGQFFDDFGIETWAVTMGPKGIIYKEAHHNGHIPAHTITAIDTLGAGDIFHGAFCAAWAQKHGFIESLKMADKVAASSCEYFGTRAWIEHTDD